MQDRDRTGMTAEELASYVQTVVNDMPALSAQAVDVLNRVFATAR